MGFWPSNNSPRSMKVLSRAVNGGDHNTLTIQSGAIRLPSDARPLPVEDVQGNDPHRHDVCGEVEEDKPEKDSVRRLGAVHVVDDDRATL